MTPSTLIRPAENEHLPYYGRYIAMVPDGDILDILASQKTATLDLLRGLPEAKGDFQYAPDKWTVKELIGHMSDTERIFAYRALRFGRNDATPLAGFEENDYVRDASFGDYSMAELSAEFAAVREATVHLFKHMGGIAPTRRGPANGAEVTVRALAYITAGHELHHLNILRTRYLNA